MAAPQMDEQVMHDLREGLTLAKGWLELLLKHWTKLDDQMRNEMITGALFGVSRLGFVLDIIDGREPDSLQSPSDRLADALERLSE